MFELAYNHDIQIIGMDNFIQRSKEPNHIQLRNA